MIPGSRKTAPPRRAWPASTRRTLGKIGNCQIGVSVHAATDAASCPLGWRLFVPEAWDDTCAETNEQAEAIAARRHTCRIPDTVRHRTTWELAVKCSTSVYQGDAKPELMDCTGRGPRPRTTRYQQAPSSVKNVPGIGEKSAEITWRHGTKTRLGNALAAMTSRFTALLVRPANQNIPKHPDGSLLECWLVTAAQLVVTSQRLTADPKAEGAA